MKVDDDDEIFLEYKNGNQTIAIHWSHINNMLISFHFIFGIQNFTQLTIVRIFFPFPLFPHW